MATAKFPTSVATDADLLVQKNRAQTTLVGALNASDTTFTLASDAFAVNMAITIDSEIILITAKSGATVTACTRAYDGTSAASHINGKLVSAYVDAIHHNQVSAEIQAIETALGAAMANVPSVTYPIAINKGGTGATTQSAALTAIMGSSALPIANGGTGAATQSAALTALMGAASLPIAVGGTAATTAAGARAALAAAILGANNDITSLTALSTPLSVAQGGTGAATLTGIPVGTGTAALTVAAAASQLQELRRKPNVTGVVYEFFSGDRIVSTDYNFPVQATPENLSPVLKTVTLTPVPLGVNGADTAHYVAIFNNSGVFQESALINGGSAVSGAASGTLTFSSLAGTYATGAYKIGSATAGIQEAMTAAASASGASVRIPAGTHTIYAKLSFPGNMSVRGAGQLATRLSMAAGFVTRAVEFNYPGGGWLDFGDLEITYTTNGTSGEALYINGAAQSVVSNLQTMNAYDAITAISPQQFHIIGGVHFPRHNGYNLSGAVATPTILGGVIGLLAGVGNGIVLGDTVAGMVVHGLGISGGVASVTSNASTGAINEVIFDGCIFDTYGTFGIFLQLSGAATSSRWIITNSMFAGNGAATYAINLTAAVAGGISGVTIAGNKLGSDGGAGILLAGISGATVTGNIVTTSVNNTGTGLALSSIANTDINVSGNIFGLNAITYKPTNGLATGISIDALAHTRIHITGNTLVATTPFSNASTVAGGVVKRGNVGSPDSIITETGANNAIAGALVGVSRAIGTTVTILLAHTLQIGANTFNLNGVGAVAIKSARNPANNIATAWAVGGVITLLDDGTQWLDLSQ